MYRSVPIFTLLLVASCFSSSSFAQTKTATYKVTYCVEIQYEFARSQGSYWVCEFESTSLAEARIMYDLYLAAWEQGSLRKTMGYDSDWKVTDVRIRTKYDLYYYEPSSIWLSQLGYRW